MNLFPAPTTSPVAGPEWTMEFAVQRVNSSSQCTAVVLKSGKRRCHISMTSETVDPDSVRMELAERARAWIAEYERRSTA